MESATLPQLTRAHRIAAALGHGWAEIIDADDLCAAFAEGGLRAVRDLVENRWDKIDSDLPCRHPHPETASVTESGRARWRVNRAGGVEVKITRPQGVAFKLRFDSNGRLLRVIPGRRRLAVGARHVEAATRIVAPAFHPQRPDWYVRTYHKLAAAVAAVCPEDPKDRLRPIELPDEPIEFFRPMAALREAGYTGPVDSEHLAAALEAVRTTRPFIYMSGTMWNDRGPAIEIFTDEGEAPGRPLTDEELTAIREAAEAVI